MNGETQTWVNLLTKESGNRNGSSANGGIGITVTSQTPRNNKRNSRVKDERTGETEVLRSQVVSLLKEKQEMMKKTKVDSQIRKALEQELRTLKKKDNSPADHPVDQKCVSLELQVSTLREALDSVTREKNLLRHQLSTCQCLTDADQSCIASEEDFSVRLQLSQLRDTLYRVEHERDALKDRLGGMEAQRQESMEQYQQEVESSMLELTNQLEELLQLNQQLQKELSAVQKDKDELAANLQQERQTWQKEKTSLNQKMEQFEEQTSRLNDELQNVKDEMLEQTTSSLAAIETLQTQVSEANESAAKQAKEYHKNCQSEVKRFKEMEKSRDEADHALLDLQHHLTLARQERDSLHARLQSAQSRIATLMKDNKANEESALNTQSSMSKLLSDLESNGSELVAVKRQLETYEQETKQLKKKLSVAQKHCKQQVENLTQQLMQKATKLSELETDSIQKQSRIKKLEGKIHEMALNHEMSSAQHESNMQNMVNNLDSTITQLETAENSNTQLQQKILDLEEEVAGWRKQLTEREGACQEVRELVEEKSKRIQELEETVAKLHEHLTNSSSDSDANTKSLLLQIQTLKDGIKQVQLERDSLNARLGMELERTEANAETEKCLREENACLQELLNTSLSLSEKLQSTLDQSQMDLSNAASSPPKHSPNRSVDVKLLDPPSSPHNSQFASPATEVLHLKQLLAEGRQTCLNLQRQHAQDKTEMAKIQGSLQALVQIQDHISTENRSVAETLSTVTGEKEVYKQESMRMSSELVSVQSQLENLTALLEHFKDNLVNQLSELIQNVDGDSDLHGSLSEHLGELEECNGLDSLKTLNSIFESFLNYIGREKEMQEHRITEEVNKEKQQKADDVESLQRQILEVCEQLKELEEELKQQKQFANEKDVEVMEYKKEIEMLRQKEVESSQKHEQVKDYKKDIDTEYQAKIAVLRKKLIEREEEVAALKSSELEMQEHLSMREEELKTWSINNEERKEEEQKVRARLASCEATLRTEVVVLDNEIKRQISDITTTTNEARDIEDECQITASVNSSQQEELTKCSNRISQLQAEVEMLRAKKSVISKYLLTHDASHDEQTEKEREELIQENDQLIAENDELRQELTNLTDTTNHLNEMVEILRLRLEEVQEEFSENHLDEQHHSRVVDLKLEKDQLKHRCNLLETDLETERLKVKRVEAERDLFSRTLGGVANDWQKDEVELLQKELQERSLAIDEMQHTLDRVQAEKEGLLNTSCSSTNKVNRLKTKLKQQIKQTNYLRMKLGYSISELRLHKQLKMELDKQISQLQNALTLSQQQHRQCLDKLLLAERLTANSPPLSTNREI